MNNRHHSSPLTQRKRRWVALLALLLELLFGIMSIPARAELTDRNKPIDIEADSVTVDGIKQISVYKGNVILTQGSLNIYADTLIVRDDQAGFQHSTALGKPSRFRQRREGKDEYIDGVALRIEYNGRVDKVQFYSNAKVKSGGNVVQGDYIMYDAAAEYAEVLSGDKRTNDGRVKAVIQPKQKNEPREATESVAPPVRKALRFSRHLDEEIR